MTKIRNVAHSFVIAAIAAPALLTGCATMTAPENLKRPESLTCIEVPDGIEGHEILGWLKFHWTTRLAKGPYISEREDADGIYYRAPPGGIYIGRDDIADKPPIPLLPRIFDGGIWVPKSPGIEPHIYTYYSTQEATVTPLPENAGCSTAVAWPDPKSEGVSTVAFATGGAIGGAIGGTIAKSTTPGSSMSYGQAAGAGAAGGAIGGIIISSMINMDVGKITHRQTSTDPEFVAMLKELNSHTISIPTEQAR